VSAQQTLHLVEQLLQVLKIIQSHHLLLKPDSLQRLHAMHNLCLVVSEGQALPEHSQLSVESLRKEAEIIREVGPPSSRFQALRKVEIQGCDISPSVQHWV